MDYQSRAQLGLKPGGLGGHDVAGVGNIHELLHRHGIEGEGHLHLTAVDAALEFAEATDTTDEVDALVLAQVAQAEDVVEDEVRGDGDIEHADGVAIVVGALLGGEAIPLSVDIEGEVVERGGLLCFHH